MLRLPVYLLSALLLSACGGSSEDSESTPLVEAAQPQTETAPEVTTPLYGAFDITLSDNKVRTVLLDAQRSYIFSVANNDLPINELMCISEDSLSEFSATQSIQTLNFNCSGSSIEALSFTIELDKNVLITYTHERQYSLSVAVGDIVEISTPNFRNLSSGSYVTRVRDDIDISRYIVASPRGPLSIDFNIFSRDWPRGGQCLASMIYRVTDFDSITVNITNETVYAPYSQTPIFPSSGCSQKILPMPSNSEPLLTHIYSLEDDSYFMIFEQANFVSMGRLYLAE
jgi:hypothetical protein